MGLILNTDLNPMPLFPIHWEQRNTDLNRQGGEGEIGAYIACSRLLGALANRAEGQDIPLREPDLIVAEVNSVAGHSNAQRRRHVT